MHYLTERPWYIIFSLDWLHKWWHNDMFLFLASSIWYQNLFVSVPVLPSHLIVDRWSRPPFYVVPPSARSPPSAWSPPYALASMPPFLTRCPPWASFSSYSLVGVAAPIARWSLQPSRPSTLASMPRFLARLGPYSLVRVAAPIPSLG